jgi:hypothetical protein
VVEPCEHDNGREFDYPGDYQLLQKDSAPLNQLAMALQFLAFKNTSASINLDGEGNFAILSSGNKVHHINNFCRILTMVCWY